MPHIFYIFIFLLSVLTACRSDEVVFPTESEGVAVTPHPDSKFTSLFLLNEGNMGSNKCTLDYLNLSTGEYLRNFYSERNPNAVMELGDVGNDIAVYGDKLYAVINCSHKVEVIDRHTGISVGKIDIPNCRFITFDGPHAYVSSYVGPVSMNADSPKGAVYEVDTASLKISRTVTVGYQPEQLAITGGKLYVANSGGYRAPDYDNTISVVDLNSFRQTEQIKVADNLFRLQKDKYGRLWVTSRGNNSSESSALFLLATGKSGKMSVVQKFTVRPSNFAIRDNLLYYISSQSPDTAAPAACGVIDIDRLECVTDNFIQPETAPSITMPYGLAVHPETGDIYITDAKNYVSSGMLYCFSPEGLLLWKVRTGDIPSAITFSSSPLTNP